MVRAIKVGIVTVGVVVALLLWLGSPLHPDLSDHGQRAIGLFVLAIGLWVTNLIPLAATSLLILALLAMLEILPGPHPAQAAFAAFGNRAVFFILGVFVLAAAMLQTGLSTRLTLLFISKFDRSPRRLLGGLLFTASFSAWWMPEHAVAAMMFPIVVEIAQALELPRKGQSVYARQLFLAMAWGAILGGIATFLGGARALLTVGILSQNHPDKNISFVQWVIAAGPLSIILTISAFLYLACVIKPDIDDVSRARKLLEKRVRQLGPMSGREMRMAALMLATICAWVLGSHALEPAAVSLVAVAAVFVLRIADWRKVEAYVNWGVILMYGGAVALGMAMDKSGAMEWIGQTVMSIEVKPLVLILILATTTLLMTEAVSNAAAVAVMLPLAFALAAKNSLEPTTLCYVIALPAGLAFSLPISSPPAAIAYSSGYYGIRQAARHGLIMTLISLVAFMLVARYYWPLVGINL